MRMLIQNNADRDEWIRRLSQIDVKKAFIAEFKQFRFKRSLNQNNLYWMWLNCIKNDTGNETNYLHEYFSDRYLPVETKTIFGKVVDKRRSTTDLDTREFTDYLEAIRMQMLEEGIYLPQPGEQGWDQFYTHYGVE